MKTPIRIIVAADFKGTLDTPRLVRATPGKTDALVEILKPKFKTKSGKDFSLKSLLDFAPDGIRAQLGDAVKTNNDLTAVLHDSTFQQAEAAWRGLDFLVTKLPEDGVLIDVLDSSLEELRRRVLDLVVKPERSGESDVPASLILGDYDFSYKAGSLEILKDLAKMGEAVAAPFVAQTGADFFNLKHLLHLPTIQNPLGRITSPGYSAFNEFRSSESSFWASLMINRFLLREPYASDDYQEPADASKPEQYLFGRAIWILGANLIKSFSTRGHLIGISGLGTGGEQLNLPCREIPITRTDKVTTPLEAALPIDIVEGLPYLGLSPLSQIPSDMGGQNQPHMIYLHLGANLHRIPDPEEKQFGLLTVEASLAYSLMMGRISNLAYRAMAADSDKDGEVLAAAVKEALLQDMWTKEPDEIQVEVEDGTLFIVYHPHLVIHTRQFEIAFSIPL